MPLSCHHKKGLKAMFTGIITAIGTVKAIDKAGDWKFTIQTPWDCLSIAMGASIACSGVCLTVIAKGDDWFQVAASKETLDLTTLSSWQEGTKLNLERALAMGDELGGHIVSGHVDGLAELVALESENDSHRLTFRAPDALSCFIAAKGSVTLDGISLTVNAVDDHLFYVNIIEHTWNETTLYQRQKGDNVYLEIDMLARYMARLIDMQKA